MSKIYIFFCMLLSWTVLTAQTALEEGPVPLPISAQGVIELSPSQEGVLPRNQILKIPVRKAPNSHSHSHLLITALTPTDLSRCEIDNNKIGVIVFSRSPGWYQINTRIGKGWVAAKHVLRFTPIEDLLKGRLTYLDIDYWDGKIYKNSSISSKVIPLKWVHSNRNFYSVTYVGNKWSEGQLWLNLRILEYEYDTRERILDSEVLGWVPAYSSKGRLVMWFFLSHDFQ